MGANDDFGQQGGERLAVNPFKPAQIYLGTHQNGLWVSNDHGANWKQSATFPVISTPDMVGVVFIRFDPAHSGVVYAGVYDGGIYRSTDNGVTWIQIPGQPTTLPDGETIRPMRSALGPDGVLYITYVNYEGLIKTSNGAVWKFNTASGVWSNITPPDAPSNLRVRILRCQCGRGARWNRDGRHLEPLVTPETTSSARPTAASPGRAC